MDRLTGRSEKGDLMFMGEQVYAGRLYEAASALEEYEDIGLTPDRLLETDKMYAEKCQEVAELRKQQRWIPVLEQLPELRTKKMEKEVLVLVKECTEENGMQMRLRIFLK